MNAIFPSRNMGWHVIVLVSCRHCQAGLTLVSLMVSMALGLFVVLAATALLLSSKSAYLIQDDHAAIQDSGRHAVEIIARAIRQSSYENWDVHGGAVLAQEGLSAGILGLDAHSLKSTTSGVDAASKIAIINGSDILGIRFLGAGSGTHGDGTMLNCAGFGVAAVVGEVAEDGRGWSIFYVAADSTGEPELRCKYKGKTSWSSVAIARGIESFQVLYGLDTDADGLANRYVSATQLHALDDALILVGLDESEQALDKNHKTHWKKVVSVKVALLVRGAYAARSDVLTKQYDLFGQAYSDTGGKADPGVRILENKLPLKSRNRMRKLFAASIQLRNQPAGGAS